MQPKKKEIVQTLLNQIPSLEAIYLFGSQAFDRATDKSDIDLGILLPYENTLSKTQLWEIKQELSWLWKQEVDLISMRDVATTVQVEIIHTGQRLYVKDPQEADAYEALTLSLYQKLNEERAGILQDIQERGSIYE